MAKRSGEQQTKHDRKAAQIARQFERDGWSVQADLPGYAQPDPVGVNRHVPDVVATKAGATRIIEVETPETMEADTEQHEAFRRSAAQRRRTSFKVEEA